MKIWKIAHYGCFIFILLAFDEVQAILGIQFLEFHRYLFTAPWLIFVVVDRLITGKLTVFPWKRKDADKKVVNDERDGF